MSSVAAAWRAKVIVNGIVGDYLEASNNELALEMGFCSDTNGSPVSLESASVEPTNSAGAKGDDHEDKDNTGSIEEEEVSQQVKRICILVHGLTADESVWSFNTTGEANSTSKEEGGQRRDRCGDHDYGSLLHQDFGITPLYLRYNTGLHISTNGHKLNDVMSKLLLSSFLFPKKENNDEVLEVTFLCHSMGGLVVRSALHYGMEEQSPWVDRVLRVMFLGTPHGGSPWEKIGNVMSKALGAVPRPYMKLAEKVANLRSAGIKDLRYGYVLDSDWQEEELHQEGEGTANAVVVESTNHRQQLPRQEEESVDWIQYYAITGTVTNNPNHPIAMAIGDGLVRKRSAEGGIPPVLEHTASCEFPGIGHNGLANDPKVYEQIKAWVVICNDGDDGSSSSATTRSRYNKTERRKEQRKEGSQPAADDLHQQHEEELKEQMLSNIIGAPSDRDLEGQCGPSRSGIRQKVEENTGPHHHSSNCASTRRDQIRGVASLLDDVVGHGARAVKEVHLSLTDETFSFLSKIAPPIAPVINRVRPIHDIAVNGVYMSVQVITSGTAQVVKHACRCNNDFKMKPLNTPDW